MGSELSGQNLYDLAVIGGGINGAGIARDAAGRGLKVLLCEKDDFGQHTSSASTKLIHGGLRYLENFDFKLVRHSLREREVLLRNSPHIIWPLRFVLPHHNSSRPRWMIRLGLLVYDSMSPMTLLRRSNQFNLSDHESGSALKENLEYAFEYSDCWVQDSRLVILNVADAAALGACVLSRARCTNLEREDNFWWIALANNGNRSMLKETCRVRARVVVNATGAWVNGVRSQLSPIQSTQNFRLVRGSHIIVRKLYEHPYAYIFQNDDKRFLFCIPYERNFTLIGTTEIEMEDPEGRKDITNAEIDYLCRAVNQYLRVPVSSDDVVWSYSGVRALYDDNVRDATAMTRDYTLKFDAGNAPIISVYGGKITTYRQLAEDVMILLKRVEGFDRPKWTQTAKLPGGDIDGCSIEVFSSALKQKYGWLPTELVDRYACHYGSKVHEMLEGCSAVSDLGIEFSPGLYQAEVDYLVNREYAMCADDIVWRRTRQGIRMNVQQIDRLEEYIDSIFQSQNPQEVIADARLYS